MSSLRIAHTRYHRHSTAILRTCAAVLFVAGTGCGARRPRAEPTPSAAVEPVSVVVPIPDTERVMAVTPTRSNNHTPLAVADGEATYYAALFDGRKTASGIVFSNEEYYAAHRTYPFGTWLRVTNLANDRTVLVRVVDRLPNATSARAQATIVDLSQRAAGELDFIRAGRVRVRVEVLEWGS